MSTSALDPGFHSIVLAAGDGRRMATLTRALFGRWIPKQFTPLDGGTTLLQETLERTRLWSSPERTQVLVSAELAPLARGQLSSHRDVQIVSQPDDRGAGPGLLLPLARVLATDVNADVVILPADHKVLRPGMLAYALSCGRRAAAEVPSGVALVGAVPDVIGLPMRWIMPGARLGEDAYHVRQLLQRPPREIAERLRSMAGLLNTSIVVGRAQALWNLCRRHLRRHVEAFERHASRAAPSAMPVPAALSCSVTPADFNRSVLAKASGLGVVRMAAGAGWSDWGEPETVLAEMRDRPGFNRLFARLMAAADPLEQQRWNHLGGHLAPGR
ncbi:MAG TPA: NTP transferase domain-containing protein [Polyangia bacterium]